MPPRKRSKTPKSGTLSTNSPESSDWTIEVSDRAVADIERLGKADRIRVLKFIYTRLKGHPDPRRLAEPLFGDFAGFGRFRVGDYRLVCRFQNDRLIILILQVGNRREVYR